MASRDPLLLERAGHVTLRIRAKPKASRTRCLGIQEGALQIALAAPPVDGAANQELIQFLQKLTRLPKRRIVLLSGETGRDKLVQFLNTDRATLEALLPLEPQSEKDGAT